tara:strand:+ start:14313 stop:14693 length:381 start_codon:yes stop_codon:yes gene_type:complete
MKLKKAENRTVVRGKVSLSIYKNGNIQFTLASQKELEMDNKHANFYQDEDSPGDWYLHLCEYDGLKINTYDIKKGPNCSSKSIAQEIKKSTRNPIHKTLRAMIGKEIIEDGLKLYPLLIKNGDERP